MDIPDVEGCSLDELERFEIELNQRHEEILSRREALLKAEESYYDYQTRQGQTFIAGCTQAMRRNDGLRRDLDEFMSEVKKKARDADPKFHRITNNYWSMVRSVFPVWADELRDFKTRRDQRRSNGASSEDMLSGNGASSEDVLDPGRPDQLPPIRKTPRESAEGLNRSEPGLRKSVSIDPIPRFQTS